MQFKAKICFIPKYLQLMFLSSPAWLSSFFFPSSHVMHGLIIFSSLFYEKRTILLHIVQVQSNIEITVAQSNRFLSVTELCSYSVIYLFLPASLTAQ